jgi:hypothetical protein
VRYWFDTEFIDDCERLVLISIGVVAEDGRTYYAQSTAFEQAWVGDWVRDNVMPHLDPPGAPCWKSPARIAEDLRSFVCRRGAEFWAYYASHDWVLLSRLFGGLGDRPPGWPLRCRDVAEWAALDPQAPRPPEPRPAHHALADAQWAKAFWETLAERRDGARARGTREPQAPYSDR